MKFEEIPDTPQNGFEDIAPLEKPEEEKPERSYGGQALEDEEQLAASMYPGTSIPLGVVVARSNTRIETGDVPYEEMNFVNRSGDLMQASFPLEESEFQEVTTEDHSDPRFPIYGRDIPMTPEDERQIFEQYEQSEQAQADKLSYIEYLRATNADKNLFEEARDSFIRGGVPIAYGLKITDAYLGERAKAGFNYAISSLLYLVGADETSDKLDARREEGRLQREERVRELQQLQQEVLASTEPDPDVEAGMLQFTGEGGMLSTPLTWAAVNVPEFAVGLSQWLTPAGPGLPISIAGATGFAGGLGTRQRADYALGMAAWSVLATYGVLKVFHKYTPILGAQMSRMKFGPADKPVMDALQRLSGPGGGKTANQDMLILGQYVGRNLRPVGGASRDLALVGGAGDFGSALISLMESETLTWAGAGNAFDNALRHTPEHVVFGLAFMGHGALKQSARAGAALKAHQKGLAQYREHHSRTDIDGLEGAVERMYIASHYLRQHQMPEFMRARLLSDTMDSMPRMTDQQVVDFRNSISRDIQAYESNVSILKQGRDSGLSAEQLVELQMQTTAQLGFARAGREILSRIDSQLARRGIQPVGSKPADPASPKSSEPLRENEERMENQPQGEEGTLPESTQPTAPNQNQNSFAYWALRPGSRTYFQHGPESGKPEPRKPDPRKPEMPSSADLDAMEKSGLFSAEYIESLRKGVDPLEDAIREQGESVEQIRARLIEEAAFGGELKLDPGKYSIDAVPQNYIDAYVRRAESLVRSETQGLRTYMMNGKSVYPDQVQKGAIDLRAGKDTAESRVLLDLIRQEFDLDIDAGFAVRVEKTEKPEEPVDREKQKELEKIKRIRDNGSELTEEQLQTLMDAGESLYPVQHNPGERRAYRAGQKVGSAEAEKRAQYQLDRQKAANAKLRADRAAEREQLVEDSKIKIAELREQLKQQKQESAQKARDKDAQRKDADDARTLIQGEIRKVVEKSGLTEAEQALILKRASSGVPPRTSDANAVLTKGQAAVERARLLVEQKLYDINFRDYQSDVEALQSANITDPVLAAEAKKVLGERPLNPMPRRLQNATDGLVEQTTQLTGDPRLDAAITEAADARQLRQGGEVDPRIIDAENASTGEIRASREEMIRAGEVMREIVTAQRLIDRSKAAEKALEILERNDQIVRDIGGQGLAPVKTDEMGRPQADIAAAFGLRDLQPLLAGEMLFGGRQSAGNRLLADVQEASGQARLEIADFSRRYSEFLQLQGLTDAQFYQMYPSRKSSTEIVGGVLKGENRKPRRLRLELEGEEGESFSVELFPSELTSLYTMLRDPTTRHEIVVQGKPVQVMRAGEKIGTPIRIKEGDLRAISDLMRFNSDLKLFEISDFFMAEFGEGGRLSEMRRSRGEFLEQEEFGLSFYPRQRTNAHLAEGNVGASDIAGDIAGRLQEMPSESGALGDRGSSTQPFVVRDIHSFSAGRFNQAVTELILRDPALDAMQTIGPNRGQGSAVYEALGQSKKGRHYREQIPKHIAAEVADILGVRLNSGDISDTAIRWTANTLSRLRLIALSTAGKQTASYGMMFGPSQIPRQYQDAVFGRAAPYSLGIASTYGNPLGMGLPEFGGAAARRMSGPLEGEVRQRMTQFSGHMYFRFYGRRHSSITGEPDPSLTDRVGPGRGAEVGDYLLTTMNITDGETLDRGWRATERWMRDTVMEHARTGEPVLDHYGRDITGTVKRIISDMEAAGFDMAVPRNSKGLSELDLALVKNPLFGRMVAGRFDPIAGQSQPMPNPIFNTPMVTQARQNPYMRLVSVFQSAVSKIRNFSVTGRKTEALQAVAQAAMIASGIKYLTRSTIAVLDEQVTGTPAPAGARFDAESISQYLRTGAIDIMSSGGALVPGPAAQLAGAAGATRAPAIEVGEAIGLIEEGEMSTYDSDLPVAAMVKNFKKIGEDVFAVVDKLQNGEELEDSDYVALTSGLLAFAGMITHKAGAQEGSRVFTESFILLHQLIFLASSLEPRRETITIEGGDLPTFDPDADSIDTEPSP